ncbi:MAG: peptidyl-prolyl cis-trans isomerase [Gammaproteobacteria bacterium]|jgi:peptidyl-prolyl cis-trans isomerase C
MTETCYVHGTLRTLLFFAALCLSGPGVCEQVLATVGTSTITDNQLSNVMASAPFATQFSSMDEDQQAALRGNMLIRLVDAEILRQEALELGLDRDPDFNHEVMNYRTGLLYRSYIQGLRDSVTIPDTVDHALKRHYKGNPDALAAARATYISKRYKPMKEERLKGLEQQYHVRMYSDRLGSHPTADTVLAEGDFFTVRYADIQAATDNPALAETPAQEAARLQAFVETTVAARAALESGVDVEQQVESYKNDLLPHMLIEKKEQEWIPDETVLRDYYQQHPEIGNIPERRHIGQLVLATREDAEAMRKRILDGESLFVLASESSIDPFGRAQAGDMGWLNEGSGFPAMEAALKGLKEGELSAVIDSPRGFHLVTIIDRRPGRQSPLAEIRDRVKQAIISERVPDYLKGLANKYPVKWSLPVQEKGRKAAATVN